MCKDSIAIDDTSFGSKRQTFKQNKLQYDAPMDRPN